MSTVNAQKMGWTPVNIRVIIYAPGAGVYLGDGHWSKLHDGRKTAAPTFDSEEAAQILIKTFNNNPIGCQVHQVSPDQGIFATRERLANALIPWE